MKFLIKALLALILSVSLFSISHATTYTVTSSSDFAPKLFLANSNPDPDVILFDIPNSGNPWNVVQLYGNNSTNGDGGNPTINTPITIDGANGQNSPRIALFGMRIVSSGVVIKNLIFGNTDPTVLAPGRDLITIENSSNISITNCEMKGYCFKGIYIRNCQNIKVSGNKLISPQIPIPGVTCNSSGQDGIWIEYSSNITIGGNATSEGNVISGHTNNAIYLFDNENVVIQNNYLGTNVLGNSRIANNYGILCRSNFVSILDNLISGNKTYGVHLQNSNGCTISRNKIGTDITGTQVISNGWNTIPGINTAGINLFQSNGNTFQENLISGNLKYGLNLFRASNNIIIGNKIGTNVTGTSALPNGIVIFGAITDGDGINICDNSTGNRIGGETAAEGNLISGNGNGIVLVQNSLSTLVYGNKIGTDITGINAIPNNNGIFINGSRFSIIGGVGNRRNIISGNYSDGISVENTGGGLVIQNNFIGIGLNQSTLPNGFNGISLKDEYNNIIGGNPLTEGNLINYNGRNGIELINAAGTFVSGNNFTSNGRNGIIVSNASIDKITQNTFTGNQIKAINLNLGTAIQGNSGWKSPIIRSATFSNDLSTVLIKGISFVPQDEVEIFLSDPLGKDASKFVGSVNAGSSGSSFAWQVTIPASRLGDFDEYYFVATATQNNGQFSNTSELSAPFKAFTPYSCKECIQSFSPVPGQKYYLSAWVKEQIDGNIPISYTHSGIKISFNESTNVLPLIAPSGPIIDGWQQVKGSFLVPVDAKNIQVELVNNNAGGDVYFDDIRVHPFRSNMKSFVYNPSTQKLVAELDENNYATQFEYDDEGILIRVKKETERGVMTIKESRNNQSKINVR